jgi:hypothetical protein
MQEETKKIDEEKMTVIIRKMAARLSELPFPEKSLHTLYIPAYFNR